MYICIHKVQKRDFTTVNKYKTDTTLICNFYNFISEMYGDIIKVVLILIIAEYTSEFGNWNPQRRKLKIYFCNRSLNTALTEKNGSSSSSLL